MPRPCFSDHPLRPRTCRLCYWCLDASEIGTHYRRLWDEPEPAVRHHGTSAHPAREIVPGLLDPIPDPDFRPLASGWIHDPRVINRHRVAFFTLAHAEMPPPGPRQGAGILMVGGGRYWPGIVVSVKMLRDTGCRLPVQIWHRGALEPVRSEDLAGMTEVEIHDLTTLQPPLRVLGGWEAKSAALLACGWERVFFIDADAYFLRDPALLLERLSPTEPFHFWHGFWENINWSVWGRNGSLVPSIHGGQFAIHLRHFWRQFLLAYWLDQHSDFTYAHQVGDQDSWRLALEVTGGPYKSLGLARWEDIAFVYDLEGEPFIVHRCSAKMFYPEQVAPGDAISNRRLDRLPGEARAWAYWQALQDARPAADVFGQVYASGLWGPGQSSGVGSTPQQAKPYLEIINALVKVSGWRRVIDLGCGDGFVASRLEAPEVVGVDCHAPHIHRLRQELPRVEWLNLDLDRNRDQLPAGDVALLKDVLHHWPNRLVRDWLSWARGCGKWRWLIATQGSHQSVDSQDCPLGGYRGLDSSMQPLRDLDLLPLCHYLHKSVLLLRGAASV
ncbi:MAG: methyltransferase domain-containing protein [Gemmataceae bacterium]